MLHFFNAEKLVFGVGSRYGANRVASAALDANIGIYLISLFSFGYSGNGALTFAGTAFDAILIDFIRHFETPPRSGLLYEL